jgi:RNA polymerase sigma-70 factor, ECF subfamily
VSNQRDQRHPDLRLVQEALRGREDAARRLIRRLECIPLILHKRNHRLGRPLTDEDIRDLVQDTLAVVWKRLPTYQGLSAIDTWVHSYCVHQYMNAIRAKRRLPVLADDSALDQHATSDHEAFASEVEFEHVHLCIDLLEPAQASVIRLKHFELSTFEQIGVTLDLSPNTVKTLYYRGLQRLKRLLVLRYREILA